jgi:hypothetical protein
MKKQTVFTGIFSLILVFGLILTGCPTDGGSEGESQMTNEDELKGKTFIGNDKKWEFISNGTYKLYTGGGDPIEWEEYQNGSYSSDVSARTVIITPQKNIFGEELLGQDESSAYLLDVYGEDTDYIRETFGKTVEEYVNGIIEKNFASQTYKYSISEDQIISLEQQ